MPKYRVELEVDIGFVLVLNLMRDRIQAQREFGPYPSRQAAIDYHNSQLAPQPWKDVGDSEFADNQTFVKAFKKGSPLEWMNPLRPEEFSQPGPYGHGIYEIISEQREISRTLIG